MSGPLIINDAFSIPGAELNFTFARSSGPGGQNVNKVNSKAVLRWNVAEASTVPAGVVGRFRSRFASRINEAGELVLASDTHREQARNVRECRDRLQAMVRSVVDPPKRRKRTRTPRRAIEARLEAKRRRGQKKQQRRRPKWDD